MKPVIERGVIESEFKKFMEKGIPDWMELYAGGNAYLVGEVFTIERKAVGLVGAGTTTLDEVFTFPLAKVLQVGDKWVENKGVACDVGDVVRLKDSEASSFINPAYREFVGNDMVKNSPTSRPVNVPPTVLNTLFVGFARRLYCPDPFELDEFAWGMNVYFLDVPNVVDKVVNPAWLWEGRFKKFGI